MEINAGKMTDVLVLKIIYSKILKPVL